MDKYLKPESLDIDASDPGTTEKWNHYKTLFGSYIAAIETSFLTRISVTEKLTPLFHHVYTLVYINISSCGDYKTAVVILEEFDERKKKKKTIFASHLLSARKQQSEENLDQHLQAFKLGTATSSLTAYQVRVEFISDTFINEISSQQIKIARK